MMYLDVQPFRVGVTKLSVMIRDYFQACQQVRQGLYSLAVFVACCS